MNRIQPVIAPGSRRCIVNGQLERDGVRAISVSIEIDHGLDTEWLVALALDETERVWGIGEELTEPYAVCVKLGWREAEGGEAPRLLQLGLVVRRLDG